MGQRLPKTILRLVWAGLLAKGVAVSGQSLASQVLASQVHGRATAGTGQGADSKIRYPTAFAPVPAATSAVLVEMATHAGVIFAGQVIAISHEESAGYVDVRFHIHQAVRGCPANGDYVLREWAGLWSGHEDRFAVGQRLLMMLTPRGPAGMSTTVGGLDGAIPLIAATPQPVADASGNVAPDEGGSTSPTVDLSWVQTRQQRTSPASAQARSSAVSGGAEGDPDVTWSGPVAPISSGPATAGSRPSLGTVLGLFGVVQQGER